MASKIITKSIVSALIVVALVSPPAFAQDYDAIKRQQQQRAEVQRQQKEAERVAAEKADRAQETAEGMQALAALKSMGSTRMRNTYPGLAEGLGIVASTSTSICGDMEELHVFSGLEDILMKLPYDIPASITFSRVASFYGNTKGRLPALAAINGYRIGDSRGEGKIYFYGIQEQYEKVNSSENRINAIAENKKYPLEIAKFSLNIYIYNNSSHAEKGGDWNIEVPENYIFSLNNINPKNWNSHKFGSTKKIVQSGSVFAK